MASYCSWEPLQLGTGGCKSAGWPPRPAASRGSPSSRGIPARPPRSPAAPGPCHGRQISANALLQSAPLSSGVPAPFRRRSRALPERRWNGAGTPQPGLPGTILPEQLLEQLPERSRKRRGFVVGDAGALGQRGAQITRSHARSVQQINQINQIDQTQINQINQINRSLE